MAPVDANGNALAPARVWMDRRGSAQIERLHAELSEEAWTDIAGASLGEYSGAISLALWADDTPDVFRRAARFCMVEDYLVGRLCGEYVLDAPNASRSLLVDLHTRDWSDQLLELLRVDRSRLSTVAESGTPIGHLRAEAADELGLPRDALVVVGAHDQTAGAVGCGAVAPGTIMLATGTAWVLLGAAAELHITHGSSLQTYCHALPGGVAVLAAYAGGAILRWARDTLGIEPDGEPADYDTLVDEALRAAHGQRGDLVFLPHFYGSGPPWGRRYAFGAIAGLQLAHSRADLVLGLLRGVACQTAAALGAMEDSGYGVSEVRMIGGGSQSDYWAQLVADASGRPVCVPAVTEAAALGAGMLAAVGAGAIPDAASASEAVRIVREIEPEQQSHNVSPLQMGAYCDALDETWRRLAEYHSRANT